MLYITHFNKLRLKMVHSFWPSLFVISCLPIVELIEVTKPRTKPNVVFIVSDDQGYGDVGFRDSDIQTPNIDSLAREGVVLENHYVQPTCSASRATLMSGRYVTRTQFWQGNIKPNAAWGLRLNETTIAEMFKRNGYSTYAVGKWHVGMYTYAHTPVSRGFDYFYGLYLGSQGYYSHLKNRQIDFRENYRANDGSLIDSIRFQDTGMYSTDLFTDKAIEKLSSHGESQPNERKPFFLYLSYMAPHGPYQVDKSKIKQYAAHMTNSSSNRRKYASMISVMDEGIGKVIDALDQHGLRENTLVVFISDNGGERGAVASNYPLRGGKVGFFEGGVRSIAVVNSPLLSVTGYTNKHLHHVTDWYTTFQYLVDDDTTNLQKPQFPLDGFNIWSSISANISSGRNEVLLSLRDEDFLHESLRKRKFKSKKEKTIDDSLNDQFIIRWKNWKLFEGHVLIMDYSPKYPLAEDQPANPKRSYHSLDDRRLYNLDVDPREINNVKDSHPEIVEQLLLKRAEYKKDLLYIPRRGARSKAQSHPQVIYPWEKNEL